MIADLFNDGLEVYFAGDEMRRAFESGIRAQGWRPASGHPATNAIVDGELCSGYVYVRYVGAEHDRRVAAARGFNGWAY